MSGSGISWVICKSAPLPRQVTTPAFHHSIFYWPGALPAANQQHQSTDKLVTSWRLLLQKAFTSVHTTHLIRLSAHLQCDSLLFRSSRVSSVCLSRVRSRKLSDIGLGAKFRRLYRKSGSPSRKMTSDFAPEVAK